jgi:centrosomal protein CEP135
VLTCTLSLYPFIYPCQDLGVDSLNLVERIFADLVLATRRCQDLEQSNEQLEDMADQKDLMLMPLKQENAKVTRENNQVSAAYCPIE